MNYVRNSSAMNYPDNKEKLQKKKLGKDVKVFQKKKKSNRIVMNDTKISKKVKNKSRLSIEKEYYKMRKNPSL